MASLPLANQVRQVYVVKTLKTDAAPSALGDLRVLGETGKYLYFQHFGHGGLTSTDRIPVENIRYIKQTPNAAMKDNLDVHTVQVKTVAAGQLYVLKVLVRNFVGQGVYDHTYRYGTYKAKTGDAAADIAAGLAEDLQNTLGLDAVANAADINHYKEKFCTVEVSSDTITIKEVEQYWNLPKFPVQRVPVEIFLGSITTDDEIEDFYWAEIGKGNPTAVNNVAKKLAELEYYAHGWRGDFYRGMNYPYNTDTEYMVDLNTNYDVIDIHYFFRGQGISSQLSEKEITLIVPAGNSEILAAIWDHTGDTKYIATEDYPMDTVSPGGSEGQGGAGGVG